MQVANKNNANLSKGWSYFNIYELFDQHAEKITFCIMTLRSHLVCVCRCVCPVFPRLGQASLLHTQPPQLNSNRTSVVRCGRQKYERAFPVILVRPDGATINIRYKEPRRILMVRTLCSGAIHFQYFCSWQSD